MQLIKVLVAAAIAVVSGTSHAEHFFLSYSLSGMVSNGGTAGCYYDENGNLEGSACPYEAQMAGTFSFDTTSSADGSYGTFYDGTVYNLTNPFFYGDGFNTVSIKNGHLVSGSFESYQGDARFGFNNDGGYYTYDYGYHGANGALFGTMLAVPEPENISLVLAGVGMLAFAVGRRKS